MKTARFAIPLFALTAAASTAVFAHHSPDHQGTVDKRQQRQQERIREGVRSGELTKGEAARLKAEQKMIRAEEKGYRVDGHLNPAERRDLQQDQNRASRHIHHQKHDAQKR